MPSFAVNFSFRLFFGAAFENLKRCRRAKPSILRKFRAKGLWRLGGAKALPKNLKIRFFREIKRRPPLGKNPSISRRRLN